MKFNILPMEFTLLFLQLLIIEASGCHYSSIKEDFSAHRRQQNRANYVPEPEEEEKIEVHNEPDKTELHLLELHGGTAKIFTVVMAIGLVAIGFVACLCWQNRRNAQSRIEMAHQQERARAELESERAANANARITEMMRTQAVDPSTSMMNLMMVERMQHQMPRPQRNRYASIYELEDHTEDNVERAPPYTTTSMDVVPQAAAAPPPAPPAPETPAAAGGASAAAPYRAPVPASASAFRAPTMIVNQITKRQPPSSLHA